MRSSGGLDTRDRMHRLRSYPQCFVAREAVDWLVRELGVGRDQAVGTGRRMVALGWIRHVLDEHDFDDAELFFTAALQPQAVAVSPPVDDLRQALRALEGGRDTAVQWAAALMRRGMLRPVFDDQALRDDATLYRPG